MIDIMEIPGGDFYPGLLHDVYNRPGVAEGITSGTGFSLEPEWYLHPDWHHCLFFISAEDKTCIGTIFFELYGLDTRLVLHLNFFEEYQSRKYTVEAGNVFLAHIAERYPLVQYLIGNIPACNRKAAIFARHFGFTPESLIEDDGEVPYTVYRFPMEKYYESI